MNDKKSDEIIPEPLFPEVKVSNPSLDPSDYYGFDDVKSKPIREVDVTGHMCGSDRVITTNDFELTVDYLTVPSIDITEDRLDVLSEYMYLVMHVMKNRVVSNTYHNGSRVGCILNAEIPCEARHVMTITCTEGTVKIWTVPYTDTLRMMPEIAVSYKDNCIMLKDLIFELKYLELGTIKLVEYVKAKTILKLKKGEEL